MDLTNRITAVLDSPDSEFQPSPPPPDHAAKHCGPAESDPPLAPLPFALSPRAQEILSDPARLDPFLDDYLEGLKLHQIARNHQIDLADVVLILESPNVVRLLDDLTRHAQLQAERLTTLARPAAITKLKNLVESDPSHQRLLPPKLEIASRETTRKAAAHLERISKPQKQAQAPRRAKPVNEPPHPAVAPPPQPKPPNASSAEMVRPDSETAVISGMGNGEWEAGNGNVEMIGSLAERTVLIPGR